MNQYFDTHHYTGKQPGPHLLITAGMHGDEFESIAAVLRLIDLFDAQDNSINGFAGRVTFAPIVNKPAFERGHRCGDDELDLARTCPGRHNGSPTQRIAHHLSEEIRSADFYIDLHTGGTKYTIFPLAGYMLHGDQRVLDAQRCMARAFNLPLVWGTAADLEGRSLSVARDAGVPAIYCEYLGAATCSPAGVEAYVTGCLNVMSELQMLPRETPGNVPSNVTEHFIENSSPGSGHLQVCHLAPVSGLFFPEVAIGTHISAGEKIGSVREIGSSESRVICADHDGLVIMLRTFPSVRQGESLAVVAHG